MDDKMMVYNMCSTKAAAPHTSIYAVRLDLELPNAGAPAMSIAGRSSGVSGGVMKFMPAECARVVAMSGARRRWPRGAFMGK